MTRGEEEPVKRWQLDATNKQVDRHDQILTSFDSKLDTIITLMQTRPTTEQMDAKIAEARIANELQLKNAIEKQDLKYSPIVENNKRLLWAVVTSGIGLIASIIMLAIAYFTRQQG